MHEYAASAVLNEACRIVKEATGQDLSSEVKFNPGDPKGDIAVPCFALAKSLRKNPAVIAKEIAEKAEFSTPLIERAENVGGYLNFFINRKAFNARVMSDFLREGAEYGTSSVGEGRKAVIDYSSPNIAKPFSIGHLRSTNIGASVCAILRFAGYEVIGDNHLGDWGTQFGKLIYAYKNWGDRDVIEKDPIKELLKLYVRFHDEAGLAGDEHPEKDNPLEEAARHYFKMLEDGDEEITSLWKWIKDISLADFQKVYDILGVSFEEMLGESFYNDKMDEIKELAESKGLLETDEDGTKLIRLDEYGITAPVLLQKKDGASLYATRDLAGILYRQRRWNPDMILYVVGEEQELYFRQLIKVSELLGFNTRLEHIPFGLMTLPAEGKFSTRKGRVIFLEDVLKESVERASKLLEGRDIPEAKKKEIAETVGIGAVKYGDLSQNRRKTVAFDWDRIISLDGNSSPYLQYSYSRARAILRKADYDGNASWNSDIETAPEEQALIDMLSRFSMTIESAAEQFAPHVIANWLFELAQRFTSFYTNVKVLSSEEPYRHNRLVLADFYSSVIKKGLSLLGVGVLEEM